MPPSEDDIAFLEEAVDTLEDILYVIGPDGDLVHVNARAEAVTGHSRDEMLPIDPTEFFEGADRDRIADAIEAAVESGESTVEADLVTAGGESIPYEFRMRALTDAEGELRAIAGIGRDVSERRERERLLDDLHEATRDLVTAGSEREVAELTVTAMESILELSRAGVHLHDEDAGALAPVAWSDPVAEAIGDPPELGPGTLAWAAFEAGEPAYHEDLAADGPHNAETPFESEFIVPLGEHGVTLVASTEPAAFTATDRRLATVLCANATAALDRLDREAELATTARRFEAIFNNPISFMAVLAPDGTVLRVNEAALEFAGVPAAAVEGEPFPETPWWTHSADLQADLEGWIERAADGEVVRFEADHHGPDGATVTIDGSLYPVTDEDGAVSSIIAIGRDISDRKARERTLARQNERLDEFASVLSHDLRNPLNVATGRLALAREECDSEHLDDVERALERMDTLVGDLLALAREGQTVDEVEPVALADLVEACWQTVETANATLAVEGTATIRADQSRLAQLLENLFRNAVEHGSTGSRASLDDAVEHGSTSNRTSSDDAVEHGSTSSDASRHDAPGDDGVTITVGVLDTGFYVADDGPGIPPEEREQVFEAGYSTVDDGTGFGLNIVRTVAEAHGWEVAVTESEAGGARFEITGVSFAD